MHKERLRKGSVKRVLRGRRRLRNAGPGVARSSLNLYTNGQCCRPLAYAYVEVHVKVHNHYTMLLNLDRSRTSSVNIGGVKSTWRGEKFCRPRELARPKYDSP